MAGYGEGGKAVIGVTGFIGSGKSKVSRFLAMRLACPHLDADKIAGELMLPGQPGLSAIQGLDPQYIMADGHLNRVLLRHDIFSDPSIKDAVDALIHPLVKARLKELLAGLHDSRVVVEVPLLFEAGWDNLFDKIVLVYADRDVCIQRVVRRDGVGVAQAGNSYQCQMGAMEKVMRADHVIDNSGRWWSTQLQLLHLVDILAE